MFQFHYTPLECWVLPGLLISRGRCEDEACHELHGWHIYAQWLWWGISLTWGVDEDDLFLP